MSNCAGVKIEFCFDIHIELLANDQYKHLRGRRYKIQAQKQKKCTICFVFEKTTKEISRFYRDLNSDRWIQSPEC